MIMSDEYTVTIDLSFIAEVAEEITDALSELGNAVARIAQPRPQREVRELRDLARDHNLDRVDRGVASVRRQDDALLALWDGEEITRFTEFENRAH